MTPQFDINELHNEFWRKRQDKISVLLKKPHIVALVATRESEKAHFVKLAATEVVRIERIRNQKPFEAELESAAAEFASLELVKAQKARAKRPRGKITFDGDTLDRVIETMAGRREHRNSSAPELWPHLYAELDRLELEPKETRHLPDPRKSAYSYEFNGKRKTICYGRFATLISKFRKKSR